MRRRAFVCLKLAVDAVPAAQVRRATPPKAMRLYVLGCARGPHARSAASAAPPDNEFNVAQSAASRATIEQHLSATKARVLIEHEWPAIAKLKKSLEFYE